MRELPIPWNEVQALEASRGKSVGLSDSAVLEATVRFQVGIEQVKESIERIDIGH